MLEEVEGRFVVYFGRCKVPEDVEICFLRGEFIDRHAGLPMNSQISVECSINLVLWILSSSQNFSLVFRGSRDFSHTKVEIFVR